MVFIFAALFGLVALYLWLTGWWFGRIIMLLPISAVLGFGIYVAGADLLEAYAAPPPPSALLVQARAAEKASTPNTFDKMTPDQFFALSAGINPDGTTIGKPVPAISETTLIIISSLLGLLSGWFIASIPLFRRRAQATTLPTRRRPF